ncbi:UNVERIFIED_CONTAM: Polygalacturonase QRT2 [Sesamum latifolium]|uniref:endo-polygalacturonase n=1 Tax=Sesamum latifolium TaxID=2727402 RepID=A0AAW2VDN3_9LAMI
MDSASGVFLIFLFTSATSILNAYEIDEDNFNVMDYGATSDDLTDDSQAFLEAWDEACSATVESSRVYVPAEKTFLVHPITFHGPCYASTINFAISGTIMAPGSPSSWDGGDASQWLGFKNVNGLKVDGFGLIDGQGKAWWDQSCRYHPQLKECTALAPTALKFVSCNESSVSNMKFTNSAQTHILVRGCNSFSIESVMIESPGNSPNTDGIHIQSSQDVLITNSKIATGDDCVSIGDHTSNIEIENVECGPGHGISIGSLGRGGNYVQVQNIRVTDASFNGTTNGARIKTWQVGRGYVRDVTFQNLVFNYVQNPIIIDQNYCNIRNACKEQETGVQISNVIYKEVLGTSTTDIAININCSKSVPCFGISMESIQLLSADVGKQVTANCSNAYGQEVDVAPGPCLLD